MPQPHRRTAASATVLLTGLAWLGQTGAVRAQAMETQSLGTQGSDLRAAAPASEAPAPLQVQPFTGGILPVVGTDPRLDNLRSQLERYFQPGEPLYRRPKWLIEPSLGADVGVTDNALQVDKPRRADLYTVLTPSIVVSGDTARLKANLTYNPAIQLYGSNGRQNRFDQFGSGSLLGVIVPDSVFLDVRGTITQSSRTGAGSLGSAGPYNRDDQVQTATFSVSPYAQHRFGGWGTGRVSYSFSRTLQDDAGDQGVFSNTANPYNTLPFGVVGNLTTHQERASFSTGENFGRYNLTSTAEAYQYSGGGAYRDAHRNQVDNQLAYALTRRIALLGGVGYQDVKYGGVPGVKVNEPSYNVGVRYTYGSENTVTVLWGRRDGIGSVAFDGVVSPTARTRITARYSTGITSDLEQIQSLLQASSIGPGGLLTDNGTGAPVTFSSASGLQNNIYKLRRFSMNGILLQDRDSVSLGFTTDDQTSLNDTVSVVNGATIPSGTQSTSYYATASWQHDLSPDMSTTLSATYGVTNSTSRLVFRTDQQQRTIGVSAVLTKQLTETLSGSVRYIFNDRSGGQAYLYGTQNTGNYTENIFLVGLRKRF